MNIKPQELKLSETTLRSIQNHKNNNVTFNLKKIAKSSKGKIFMIASESKNWLRFISTIEHNNKFYGGLIPKPESLFFAQSIEFEKKASEYLNSFPELIKETLHSFANPKDNKPENCIFIVNDDAFNLFIMYKISSISALISTVECFINLMIPEDFTIENNKNRLDDKASIERYWDLKSKLKVIIPKIKQINDLNSYAKETNRFIELTKIRNEFTHIKTKLNDKNLEPFLENYTMLINLDLKQKIKETKKLLDLIEPNYF